MALCQAPQPFSLDSGHYLAVCAPGYVLVYVGVNRSGCALKEFEITIRVSGKFGGLPLALQSEKRAPAGL
jgi:hypothetical protein